LNAVQRRYPQIYQSEERLLVKPETVRVQPKDFLISIKSTYVIFSHANISKLSLELVPSSARSSASIAAPLPLQLVPLLDDALTRVRQVLDVIIPVPKKRTALEEALYEDEGDDDNTLEKEEFLQCKSYDIAYDLYSYFAAMETLRVYRPRVILCGPQGMGQTYVGAAALHQLEGFHIQSLDLASLLGDASRVSHLPPLLSCFLFMLRRQWNQPSFNSSSKQSGIDPPLFISPP